MKQVSCYLCGSESHRKRPGKVRDNEKLEILECSSCGLVFLSSINHIDESHYQDSGMHGDSIPDLAEWLNETESDDDRRFQYLKDKLVNKSVLDFGCGVGGFLLKAKKIAKLAEGIELEIRLQEHFNNNNLKVYKSLSELKETKNSYNIITAFHVVEHLPDPIPILKDLSMLLSKNGELIIEVPSSNDALITEFNSREFSEFTYWSQHLYLYNASTFTKLIKKAGLQLNWVKHIQRYPLSNHLYWLSEGKPGGHKNWNHLRSEELDRAYENILAANGLTDTIIASVSYKNL